MRRAHKYSAVATTVDNVRFASKAEAQYYAELKLLEKAGEIRNLKLQPWFVLLAPVIRNGLENLNEGTFERVTPIGQYRADFSFEERMPPGWRFVVADVKGVRTAVFAWKARHFHAQYGIEIREITKGRR